MVILRGVGASSMVLFIWGIVYIQAPFSARLDRKFDKGALRSIPVIAGGQSIRSFWWTTLAILAIYFFLFIGVHAKNKAQSIIEHKQNLILVDSKATSGTADDYSLGTSIN